MRRRREIKRHGGNPISWVGEGEREGGVLLRSFGKGCAAFSPNPYPISARNVLFFTTHFRAALYW